MENQEVIRVDHVSMRFSLASERVDNFKEYVIKRKATIIVWRILGFERCKL